MNMKYMLDNIILTLDVLDVTLVVMQGTSRS